MKIDSEKTKAALISFAEENKKDVSWVGLLGSFWRNERRPNDIDVLVTIHGNRVDFPGARAKVLKDLEGAIRKSGVNLPIHSEIGPADFAVEEGINFALVVRGAVGIYGEVPEWIIQLPLQGME